MAAHSAVVGNTCPAGAISPAEGILAVGSRPGDNTAVVGCSGRIRG